MTKYLVLTSILALAACGGGSGGHSGGGAIIPPNDNIGNEVIGDNTDNNQGGNSSENNTGNNNENNQGENTGNESGNSSDNNTGDNKPGNNSGENNTGADDKNFPKTNMLASVGEQKLEDIEFKAIETGDAVNHDYLLKFKVNSDNQIVAVISSYEECVNVNPTTGEHDHEIKFLQYSRKGNENRFTPDNAIYDGGEFWPDDIINLTTLGNNVGLSYSDFGYYEIEDHDEYSGDYNYNNLFAGGYSAKHVEKPQGEARFDGTAVAAIEVWQPSMYEQSGTEGANQLSVTDDAYLIVKDGNETLTANFSKSEKPWYDVVIHNDTVSFNNGDNFPEWLTITDDMKNDPYLKVEHTYFGDGDASEVISTLQYKTDTGNNPYSDDDFRMIEVGMAFGGKK